MSNLKTIGTFVNPRLLPIIDTTHNDIRFLYVKEVIMTLFLDIQDPAIQVQRGGGWTQAS